MGEHRAEYYRLANELVRERLGGLHSARCLVASVDFADIEALQVRRPVGRCRAAPGRRGADGCRRPAPTSWCSAPTRCTRSPTRSQDAVTIPLLHLGDATAAAVRPAGVTDGRSARHRLHHGAGLLPRPAGRARPRGAGPARPTTGSRSTASSTTSCASASCGRSPAQTYREVIGRLVEAGAEGIVLGCTEIELLVGADDSPVPVFPTTRAARRGRCGPRARPRRGAGVGVQAAHKFRRGRCKFPVTRSQGPCPTVAPHHLTGATRPRRTRHERDHRTPHPGSPGGSRPGTRTPTTARQISSQRGSETRHPGRGLRHHRDADARHRRREHRPAVDRHVPARRLSGCPVGGRRLHAGARHGRALRRLVGRPTGSAVRLLRSG